MYKKSLVFVVVLMVGLVVCASAQPVLVGHWKFDEGSGAVANDSSVSGNNGAILGTPGWRPGDPSKDVDMGTAILFDGTDDAVEVPHAAVFDFSTESFTVSFMLCTTHTNPTNDDKVRWLCKGTRDPPDSGKRYEVAHKGTTVRFVVDDAVEPVGKTQLDVAQDPFITGEWVHVVAVRDRAADRIRLYVDAVQQGELQDDTETSIAQDEPLLFGAFRSDAGWQPEFMVGKLDDVRLYSGAMGPLEISLIYATPTETPEAGAQHWELFD